MNIIDIVNETFKTNFEDKLEDRMLAIASINLIKKMYHTFGNQKMALEWFYSKIPALDNERPYDYCKRKQEQDILDILGRIDNGI